MTSVWRPTFPSCPVAGPVSSRQGQTSLIAFAVLAALCPAAAYGSFSGGGPCRDVGCMFFMVGIIIGTVGVPVSALVFGALHAFLCHEERSRVRQFLLGAGIGMVAYEVSALFAAMFGVSGVGMPAKPSHHMLLAFAGVYLALAACSALFARSRPSQCGGAAGSPIGSDP